MEDNHGPRGHRPEKMALIFLPPEILQKGTEMIIITDDDISGAQYSKLIDHAFRRCDRFALNIPVFGGDERDNERRVKKIVRQMRPYITDKLVSKKYFSIKSSCKREIYAFSTSEGMRDMVRSTGGIYKWIYPELPEDLSFFDSGSGRCWLGTVAHEKEYRIYSSSDADINFLEDHGISYICDERDDYVPYLKQSAEYIKDSISKISYEIRDDWERSGTGASDPGMRKVTYRHSIAGDDIDDIFVDVAEVSTRPGETADEYISKQIRALDENKCVFKIAQREIPVGGITSTEYSYRRSGSEEIQYTKYIEVFSRVSENTVAVFRSRVFSEESECAFRRLLDSVEMAY